MKRYPNDIKRNNTCTEGKAAGSADMNDVTTAFSVVDRHEKDLNALVNENFKILDTVLFFT